MYLKIVLTVIALLLAIRCTVDFLPSVAQAGDIMKVDIVKVNGWTFFDGALPVKIE